ncbi:hypothetical protein DFA_07079 [Cavenderia fasciculata]|uniref:WD40 repeat-containing protein n=1 Tax=Cavenderia fasciculata TaxID=261658 RepID=F4PVF4_CACFS|nr:uncharacterized protein DFA_07079 [Cavenderia fasciculata]EGG19968.1 hypothetical protein DFA_07079 [Cavenderia fasciculata]|eukprot:XP_004366951.1 hypothetical protein DFA_07079 [Cavenderia fasciculata]
MDKTSSSASSSSSSSTTTSTTTTSNNNNNNQTSSSTSNLLPPPHHSNQQQTSDAYYKNHLDTLTKEIKLLKTKLDTFERENKDLKKSIYDLTGRYDQLVYQTGKTQKPFNIDAILSSQTPEVTSSIDASTTIPSPPPSLVSDGSSLTEERLLSQTQRSTNKKMDERHFFYKFTLKGHSASVYTVKFSPCGKMLASGSFDKSVKIWDVFNQREITTFSDHSVNVSELAWNNDSTEIISGSYDKSVKLWDLQTSKNLVSYSTSGFILDVMYSPIDNNIFFAGNTQNHIIGFDKRTPNSIFVIENDSLVNALHVFKDGQHILTGDSNGKLKTWDIRKATKVSLPEGFHNDNVDGTIGSYSSNSNNCLIDTYESAPENRPISSICMNLGSEGDDGRFLAVNSYDNVLRVYDRSKVSIVSHPYSLAPMKLLHSLTGHKNKNWPIKSSIFVGKDYSDGPNIKQGGEVKLEDDDDDENRNEDINQSVLLATGSADYNAYLFDIGFSKQSGRLLQKLEGHTDRVYSVKFHPSEPILASCSADSTIRLWSPKKKL